MMIKRQEAETSPVTLYPVYLHCCSRRERLKCNQKWICREGRNSRGKIRGNVIVLREQEAKGKRTLSTFELDWIFSFFVCRHFRHRWQSPLQISVLFTDIRQNEISLAQYYLLRCDIQVTGVIFHSDTMANRLSMYTSLSRTPTKTYWHREERCC